MHISRHHAIILIFNLLVLLVFAVHYLLSGNLEFLLYIGVVLIFVVLIGRNIDRIGLDGVVLWGLSVWNLLHMLGGSLPVGEGVLYTLRLLPIIDRGGDFYVLKMDQVIHFYGFGIAAMLVFQLVYPHTRGRTRPVFPIFIAWIGSMGLGALNEVVEFIALVSFDQTGVGSIYNTGLDMVFNLGGALAGALCAHVMRHRQAAAPPWRHQASGDGGSEATASNAGRCGCR